MDEQRRHWLYLAVGCTIAAVLYTDLALWRGKAHTPGVGLGWVMTAYWWGVVLWEYYKGRRAPR